MKKKSGAPPASQRDASNVADSRSQLNLRAHKINERAATSRGLSSETGFSDQGGFTQGVSSVGFSSLNQNAESAHGRGTADSAVPSQIRDAATTPITSTFVTVGDSGEINGKKRPRIEMTPAQLQIIENNRQKALEIRAKLNGQNNQSISIEKNPPASDGYVDNIRLNHNNKNDSEVPNKRKYDPPAIRRSDYIEYDFATMKDSRGGFINTEELPNAEEATTLDEWKEKQKQQIGFELPPPIDIENAPKCFECNSIEISPQLFDNFRQVRACRKCIKEKPEKYSLLTKTECREDYLLTDPELKDVELLPRIEKPNPHGFSRMQLFLRFQVEEYAWKKWGSSEKLDEEWERREAMRIKRRDKKYNDQLREMRKKTRAEEYTRKLRNGQGLGERHVHDWSAPLKISGEFNMVMKRCIDCGVETEEIII